MKRITSISNTLLYILQNINIIIKDNSPSNTFSIFNREFMLDGVILNINKLLIKKS